MIHPLVKLISNEATSTPTWKPGPCCQRQAPLPTKTQALQWGNKTKHIPTWWTPERSCLLTHTEQKHSHRFKLGIYRQKEPWYLMYTLRLHTQNLSHNTSGQASIVQNCLALSTLHICLVLSAVRKRWQNRLTGHLYRLSRPHPS